MVIEVRKKLPLGGLAGEGLTRRWQEGNLGGVTCSVSCFKWVVTGRCVHVFLFCVYVCIYTHVYLHMYTHRFT